VDEPAPDAPHWRAFIPGALVVSWCFGRDRIIAVYPDDGGMVERRIKNGCAGGAGGLTVTALWLAVLVVAAWWFRRLPPPGQVRFFVDVDEDGDEMSWYSTGDHTEAPPEEWR